MNKQISLMDAEAYEAFVSNLITGAGEYHLNPSGIEALPATQEVQWMTGKVGADDAGAIFEADEAGNVTWFGHYPVPDVRVVRYFS
jgi:hypothetical protein